MLQVEREYWSRGVTRIGGVDEVGVGPLAGPLVAAAVILPPEVPLRGIDDSKRLSSKQRDRLAQEIESCALACGIGVVEVEEVDRLNVFWASVEAMRRAVGNLAVDPEQLLVDARWIPDVAVPQQAIVGGDRRSYSIAAASIVAKVARDRMMCDFDRVYPEYGFARHMGYGTRFHLDALARFGPSPIHRQSFVPVRQARLPGF
jgi:ribonuclease HII